MICASFVPFVQSKAERDEMRSGSQQAGGIPKAKRRGTRRAVDHSRLAVFRMRRAVDHSKLAVFPAPFDITSQNEEPAIERYYAPDAKPSELHDEEMCRVVYFIFEHFFFSPCLYATHFHSKFQLGQFNSFFTKNSTRQGWLFTDISGKIL